MWLLHLPLFFASVAGSLSVKFPKSSKANDPLTPADVLQEFQSRPPSGPEDLRRLFFRDAYPFWQPEPPVLKSGDPLILTSLLENGEIEEARRLSRVKLPNYEEEIESYSGFFNIDKAHNSNLFYWFFPSQQVSTPVCLSRYSCLSLVA
ncbi:unnamed protein product [Bemisia tabaci]|uniref:Uncharacterized protein n=1 Tax=Bemisia tabaci TaxID=7038 RepID=A0AAI8UUB3_BEMTA|nr:unnamed protein product [Bemisia tabaci]